MHEALRPNSRLNSHQNYRPRPLLAPAWLQRLWRWL
jgi:hypothetical protein